MNLDLKPFSLGSHPFKVTSQTKLQGDRILQKFEISGHIDILVHPSSQAPSGSFINQLWEDTCFELFLAFPEGYIEWNFSLQGYWACYEFSTYRTKERNLAEHGPFRFSKKVLNKSLTLEIEIPKKVDKITGISPCVVIRTNDETSYFSHSHARDKPDFHAPESFLKL